jgi:hypothetical protein
MIQYTELREKLNAASPNDWENILEDTIERQTNKEDELGGSVIGFSVSDIVMDDDSIAASVYYQIIGEAKPDDDGDYQDEDGDSYDYEESEYTFLLVITSTETRWEAI